MHALTSVKRLLYSSVSCMQRTRADSFPLPSSPSLQETNSTYPESYRNLSRHALYVQHLFPRSSIAHYTTFSLFYTLKGIECNQFSNPSLRVRKVQSRRRFPLRRGRSFLSSTHSGHMYICVSILNRTSFPFSLHFSHTLLRIGLYFNNQSFLIQSLHRNVTSESNGTLFSKRVYSRSIRVVAFCSHRSHFLKTGTVVESIINESPNEFVRVSFVH